MIAKKTKYGLKALVFIARNSSGNPVQIKTISESEQISRKFLESILLSLKSHGLLGSKKGKFGGYYLLKTPEEIKMSAVIRILEGPIAMVPCVSLNFYEKCEDCKEPDHCAVRNLMEAVRDSTLEIYNNRTLADLI